MRSLEGRKVKKSCILKKIMDDNFLTNPSAANAACSPSAANAACSSRNNDKELYIYTYVSANNLDDNRRYMCKYCEIVPDLCKRCSHLRCKYQLTILQTTLMIFTVTQVWITLDDIHTFVDAVQARKQTYKRGGGLTGVHG